jgi:hypothetical protein
LNPASIKLLLENEPLPAAIALDLCTGIVATILVVVVALTLGGFSFFTPWLIVTPIATFLAGLVRGKNQGQILLRAIAIGAFLLLLLLVCGHGPITLSAGTLIIVAPAVGGIATRRWRIKSRPAERVGAV